MRELAELLKKYEIDFSKEVFYILLNCINKRLDTFEDLVALYKDKDNYIEIREIYKKFYDFMIKYFEDMDIRKDIMLHHKVVTLVDFIIENNVKKLQAELKTVISNVIDLIFIKYNLNISELNTNDEIRRYLMKKIEDDKIVNLLVLLLLADTTLTNQDIETIPEEEFENIISSIILISIYICKGK